MVTVQTNDPANRSVNLTCSGKVLRAFLGSPPSVRFKTIERDSGPQSAFTTLRRGDGGEIKPELIPPFPKGIEAKLTEMRPAELYRVDVTLSPPWPNEPIRQFLRVRTGIEEAPYERIRVDGAVVPRLRVVPRSFVLRPGSDGSYEQSVKLEWDRSATTTTARVSVNDPNLSVSLVEKDGSQVIVLRGKADYKATRVRPAVTVETDDPVVPKLVIKVRESKRRGIQAKRAAIGRKPWLNKPAAAKQATTPAPVRKPLKE